MTAGRPKKIPARGDVDAGAIARLLGVTAEEFEQLRAALESRGFPGPDPTTGRYCVEAVERWRLLRHAPLFPEVSHHMATGLPKMAGSGHAPNPWDQ